MEKKDATFCIVPYCHADFAWTHHREWHAERYAVSTAEALDLMRDDPDFRFCVEPWIDQLEPFLARCPDRVDELAQRLASGQMGVQAFTLTSPRPATCADETFIRNMILGRRRYQQFAPGVDLSVMACPDVGIGHSQMPQVIALAGGRMYRGWRSDAALSAKNVPRDFVWIGLDGTRMITSRGCYAGFCFGGLVDSDFNENWAQTVERLWAGDLAHSTSCSDLSTFWVSLGHDDARPLRALPNDVLMPIRRLMEAWNLNGHGTMVFATPAEYLAKLECEDLPEWHGVLDPIDVAYNSGWHGEKGLWRLRQDLDTAVVVAERACAMARLSGADGVAGPDRLEELWIESVRIASHALQWIFERDWEWLLARARYALREAWEECDRAVAALSGVGRASGEPPALTLFNPLPHEREEIIEAPWANPRQDVLGLRVLDESGVEIPLQMGEQVGETWGGLLVEPSLILKARVPAMGIVKLTVEDATASPTPTHKPGPVISNGMLDVAIGPRGLQAISSAAAGLCLSAPRGGAIGDVRFFEMADGPLHIGPITGEVGVADGDGGWITSGPLRSVYRWRGCIGCHQVCQDVIIDDGAAHVDLITRVLCRGANGFFALCLNLPMEGDLSADIPFGVEPRDLANETYAHDMPFDHHNIERHREDQFWARSFASVSDGERGVSVISADGDKYWTFNRAARTLRHILFTPLDDEAEGWEAWVTKDRLALGWHTFRHRIALHTGDWQTADICGESDRLRHPIRVVKPLGPRGRGVAPAAQLSIRPSTVRLSAFHEIDGGVALRVYESSGSQVEAVIELPPGLGEPCVTDFDLNPVESPVELNGRELRLRLRPWQIVTVRLAAIYCSK